MTLADDFTGSRCTYDTPARFKILVPVVVKLTRCEDWNRGVLERVRWTYTAEQEGQVVASSSVFDKPHLTRSAAISAARVHLRERFK